MRNAKILLPLVAAELGGKATTRARRRLQRVGRALVR